jgi:phosphatidylglycerophosphate synthase
MLYLLIPNAVSFMRVIASPLVAYYSIQNQWDWAFYWLICGALTDFFDGEIARLLRAESYFGKHWVDPVCDFVFALGVLYGFVFHDDQYQSRLVIAEIIVVVTVLLKLVKEFLPRSWAGRFAYGIQPLVYCACVVAFFYYYLDKAVSDEVMAATEVPIIIITAFVCWFKRERFKDWFGALFRRRQENLSQ